MPKKIALITGVTGQDGSYLTDFLLNKGYKIIGVKRRSSSFNTKRIDHIYNDLRQSKNFRPYYGDLTDSSNILRVIQSTKPMKYIISTTHVQQVLDSRILSKCRCSRTLGFRSTEY